MARKFGQCGSAGTVSTGTGEKLLGIIFPPTNGKIAVGQITFVGKGNNPSQTTIECYGKIGTISGGTGGTSTTARKTDSSDSSSLQTTQTIEYGTPPTVGSSVEVFRGGFHAQSGFVHRREIRITAGSPLVLYSNADAATNITWTVDFEE